MALILNVFLLQSSFSEELQKQTLTPGEIETLFLKQNLQLIAEKMNVALVDAEMIQAKLWDNPTFSIGEFSAWSTRGQREGKRESVPPLFGSFGKNTQFTAELSQRIQISGKRQKRIQREKVSKEIAIQEFEELLRDLKLELRKSIHETIYIQSYQKILEKQIDAFSRLVERSENQLMQKNIAKHELLRLQASLFELGNEFQETQMSLNEHLKEIKALLGFEPTTLLEIKDSPRTIPPPQSTSLNNLIETALENRPDIKLSNFQTQYFEKSLSYEKAQRIPDLTLSLVYDRYGSTWKDFWGFGFSVELPILDRNQGNIKTAQINQQKSQYVAEQQQNKARHEVVEVFENYSQAYHFYNKIDNSSLSTEFENMLEIYAKNFLNRNISMLEYIDFMDAYKSNKKILLSAKKNLSLQFEELQHKIGLDIRQ